MKKLIKYNYKLISLLFLIIQLSTTIFTIYLIIIYSRNITQIILGIGNIALISTINTLGIIIIYLNIKESE